MADVPGEPLRDSVVGPGFASARLHTGPMTIDRVKGGTAYCTMSQASSEILSQALRVFQRPVNRACTCTRVHGGDCLQRDESL